MASDRRRQQISRVIHQRLAQIILKEIKDPRLAFLTITEVEINKDLTLAKVYWSVLNQKEKSRTEKLLKHAHGFLRSEVARALDLRSAPNLTFYCDERLERQSRIEALIRNDMRKNDQ